MSTYMRLRGKVISRISVEELRPLKPEELKQISVIDLCREHVDRSLSSHERTPGESED
jgi:hypothetical protein